MAAASYIQHSFLGGEVSKSVQGRLDNPQYRTWLNVMLNWIPIEGGSMTRRAGSRFCGTTRGGAPGRVVRFDFNQARPYTMEFTDGFLRFWDRTQLVPDSFNKVAAISSANPAVVTTTNPVAPWVTGNRVVIYNLGINQPLLQNRVFVMTATGANTFTITDAITNLPIDGTTLGPFGTADVYRVTEIPTPYLGNMWESLRAILCDIPIPNGITAGAVLLHEAVPPYLLTVTRQPDAPGGPYAAFSLDVANLKDGPYFDPPPGGATLTPSGLSGLITLTIQFPAYDATLAYSKGDFAYVAPFNYQSIADQNVGNNPPASPLQWQPVSSGLAVGPEGFQGTDVGRMVRLYSEPPLWDAVTAYAIGAHVSYPSGVNGAYSYWRAIIANTNVTPGTSVTTWAVDPGAALWSWGKITALANLIDPALGGSVNIGDMTGGGGIAAGFDADTDKNSAACASVLGAATINDAFLGKNYTASGAQAIASVTVFPSADLGFGNGSVFSAISGVYQPAPPKITINLRAKATPPGFAGDGTLLGTSGILTNINAPVQINSNDAVTTWNYVWVEVIGDCSAFIFGGNFMLFNNLYVAQVQFFSPVPAGGGNAVTLQLLGPKLLYTTPVRVWRLGLYSNTTGWPTAGVWHEGRLWLTGAVANRIDSSQSNGIQPNGSIEFGPTNADGSVSDNCGISYIFNAPDINPIFWMSPDQLGIVCGTQAGEWLVQASNNNNPLSPTNIQAHRMTTNRCANIEPRRAPLTLMVVHNMQRMILEYFSDVFSGKFGAKQITLNTQHLTHALVEELAFQRELAPVLWARCRDGSLIGCTYKRESLVSSQDPDYAGWHRHELGSGRTVESLCTGSNVDATADTLYMVTTDAGGIRHVEMLNDLFEEGDDPNNAWHLDDAVFPTSHTSDVTPIVGAPYGGLTLNGLWHLNGKTVSVWAGGLDCGDFTVTNGSTFVPYGDGVAAGTANGLFTEVFVATNPTIIVGFTYTSDAQIVRPLLPVESGARAGPALGKRRRTHRYALLGLNMAGMSIGTVFNKLFPVLFKSDANVTLPFGQTFSGVYRDQLNDDYSLDSMVCLRITRPYTAVVQAIESFLQTQDE